MKWIRGFIRFWYDFVVGDDWTIAVAVVVAIALTALLAHHGWNAWPVLPLCVVGALSGSLWRARSAHHR